MYLLILYIGAIHYICFMIATILLFIGMRNGNVGLLNTSAVLFIVSIIGTLDPYWTGPNILSLVLGVLVFIGGIFPKIPNKKNRKIWSILLNVATVISFAFNFLL